MSIQYPIRQVHALSADEVLNSFKTGASNGLTLAEAEQRSRTFGLNVYQTHKQKSVWMILLDQFKTPIVYLLATGVVVSFYFKDTIEAISILAVIFVNAMIGFLMELQARISMNALRKMDVNLSKLIREGKVVDMPSEKIAPGDLIVFEAGDIIPADGRLIEANQLQCDESSLTGESLPTEKKTDALPIETALADQHNMVFKGTSVMSGNGKAVVTGISTHTQLGTIIALVETATPGESPLNKKLNALTKKLIGVTLIMTVIFGITAFIQGKSWILIIETCIALAIAAIPEGLPIVATVALAYGMLLMAKRNVIVKKLSAVETLGSSSVILTDKTGTLTENRIHVESLSFPGETIQIKIEDNVLRFPNGGIKESKENFDKLILIGTLCNDAVLKHNHERNKSLGDPIEIALLQLAIASGKDIEELNRNHARLDEIPFNSEIRMMATLNKLPSGKLLAAKGSVEQLLGKCSRVQRGQSITEWKENEKNEVLVESERMSSNGLRVLAFAYKQGEFNKTEYLKEMVYVGAIGFLDPPRIDIKSAILSCRKAGIRVVMITGDHPMTALNIAHKVGLLDESDRGVITGDDIPPINSLSDEWKKKIQATAVFARATPQQKLDIADVYQKAGNIVAMTGDGVNDAPALKKADVGIAMGLRGTSVAKETASIIVKDDSFTSIVEAVEHGREIFQNIQKFVIYLVSCNLSEILIVTTLGFMAPASVLLPLQILFLNMVTDVFPALALGLGKGDNTVMLKQPRDPKNDIVLKRDWIIITLYAVLMTLVVIGAVLYCQRYISRDATIINNMAFITLTFVQLFHVFNMSSLGSPFLINEISRNKFVWIAIVLCSGLLVAVFASTWLRTALSLSVPSSAVWVVSLIFSAIPLLLIQVYKAIWKRTSRVTAIDLSSPIFLTHSKNLDGFML